MSFFDYFLNHYVHLIFGPTFIITDLVACLSIAFLFHNIKVKEYKSWLYFGLDFLCTAIINILFSCAYTYLFSLLQWVIIDSIFSFIKYLILGLLHVCFIREYPNFQMRLNLATSSSFFIASIILLSGVVGSWAQSPDNRFFQDLTFYIIILMLSGIIVLYKMISPFKYRFVKSIPSLLINISYLLALFIVISFRVVQSIPGITIFIATATIMVLMIVTYISFYLSVKDYNQMIYSQMSALKQENEKSQILVSKHQFEEYQRIRHDWKNELLVLETLFGNKDYEKMEQYFADVNEKVHIVFDNAETGNTLINTILNMEIAKSKSLNINLHYKVAVPNELSFKDTDLTSLLCNLLDNAIEAQERANIHDPVTLTIVYKEPCLFITIVNKYSADENPLNLKSYKHDRRNHGYGTKIISSIIEKNNGVIDMEAKDGVFKVEAMISSNKKE